MEENTKIWDRYQQGLSYQSKIKLLPTIDKNERFYSGNQWEGITANKLPTPILNVTKRVVDYKISAVMSDLITMQFSADGVSDNTQDQEGQTYNNAAKLFTQYSKTQWENLKMDSMNERGLLKSTLAGDLISNWFWHDKINDFYGELINSCNYFPGDPNNPEINNAYEPAQPYIILELRRQVEDVRQEALKNGVTKEEVEGIVGDAETQNQAGDRAKSEIDNEGKCIVLLSYTRKLVDVLEEVPALDELGQPVLDEFGQPVMTEQSTGEQEWKIFAEKATRTVTVRKEWDTGLHRYPVAKMSWYEREGCAHGEAEATSLIPNNIMINQQAAMIALWISRNGYPKVIYDKDLIDGWTNDVATAIPVKANGAGVANAAQYMQPAQMSNIVMKFMEWFIQITKDMAGANDAAVGEANPTNTSAIIVLQKASAIPLSPIKRRFFQYIEDIGLIWLDFIMSKYTEYPTRDLTIKQNNVKEVIPFDTSILKKMKMKLKIDVGASSQWNEAAAIQTLDNLLQGDRIDFIEYLKRIPNGVIPDKQGLIDNRESAEAMAQDADKKLLYELMARFVEQLPPEVIKSLNEMKQNNPEQFEAQVKQMIQQGGTV